MNEKYEKLIALMNDDNRAKDIFSDDIDKTLEMLSANGIELSRDEFTGFVEGMLSEGKAVADGKELSETDLEDVAGGGSILYIIAYEKGLGYASEGKCVKAKWWWPKSYKKGFKDGQTAGGCVG